MSDTELNAYNFGVWTQPYINGERVDLCIACDPIEGWVDVDIASTSDREVSIRRFGDVKLDMPVAAPKWAQDAWVLYKKTYAQGKDIDYRQHIQGKSISETNSHR